MNGRLVIGFRPEEGAVGRIVGLCERRGFELKGLAMSGEAPDAKLTLELRARDAGRRFDVLDLQLRRLSEVGTVSIFEGAKS